MKKNINIFLLLCLTTLFFSSCQDELELVPISEIGDNGFYNNSDELEGAVVAIYDGLQAVPLREFAMTEMRSDNTKTKSSEGDWAQFESFNVQPTNLAIGAYWAANYNVIFRANRVLENLDVVTDIDLKNQFEGEAKFNRALAHFNLVRAYGDVPIIDQVIIQTDEDFFAKDPAESVLEVIESDFTDASNKLPETNDYGRATSGAASAMLGKVMLTQGNYNGAEMVLEEVINSGLYALEANYHDVFYTEGNAEVLFAIPYLDDDINESQDFSFEMTPGGVVSGLNYITDDFDSAVDPNDTLRFPTLYNLANPAQVGKFITSSADARLCGNDWIVMRYADVLLLYAEAILGASATTSNANAVSAFNEVRTRAGQSTITGDLTKELLLGERRVELAFENHRFYDLVRFGMAAEVLGAFASSTGESFEPTDILLPIPQAEINVSNGLLIQNPGY